MTPFIISSSGNFNSTVDIVETLEAKSRNFMSICDTGCSLIMMKLLQVLGLNYTDVIKVLPSTSYQNYLLIHFCDPPISPSRQVRPTTCRQLIRRLILISICSPSVIYLTKVLQKYLNREHLPASSASYLSRL